MRVPKLFRVAITFDDTRRSLCRITKEADYRRRSRALKREDDTGCEASLRPAVLVRCRDRTSAGDRPGCSAPDESLRTREERTRHTPTNVEQMAAPRAAGPHEAGARTRRRRRERLQPERSNWSKRTSTPPSNRYWSILSTAVRRPHPRRRWRRRLQFGLAHGACPSTCIAASTRIRRVLQNDAAPQGAAPVEQAVRAARSARSQVGRLVAKRCARRATRSKRDLEMPQPAVQRSAPQRDQHQGRTTKATQTSRESSFRRHRHVEAGAGAASGRHDEPWMKRDLEVHVDALRIRRNCRYQHRRAARRESRMALGSDRRFETSCPPVRSCRRARPSAG